MAKKIRLDQLLVQRGLFPSREKAQSSIMAGLIRVGGLMSDKCGTPVADDVLVEIVGKPHPYASRGGLKLQRALEILEWDVSEVEAIDLGASTGGFTDCLLQRGAARVCAVDVGRGQLDLKLQQDPRVIVKDKTNARYLQPEDLPFTPQLVTIDTSFISLRLLLPVVWSWGAPRLITLIKPQFETEAKYLRKGVVVDPKVQEAVLDRIITSAEQEGWQAVGLGHSPLRGPAGNLEFVAGFVRSGTKPTQSAVRFDYEHIVAQAHQLAV